MTPCRKNDFDYRDQTRSNRLFQRGGLWYFKTREGTVEGPFVDHLMASDKLGAYLHDVRRPPLAPAQLSQLRACWGMSHFLGA